MHWIVHEGRMSTTSYDETLIKVSLKSYASDVSQHWSLCGKWQMIIFAVTIA